MPHERSDTLLIKLRGNGPLYARESIADRNAITEALLLTSENPSRYSAVLLVQNQPMTDASAAFANELEETLFLEELTELIYGFRLMLQGIRTSPVMWFYSFRGDVLGSYFELLHACKTRLCFDPLAFVGFPELVANLFPPGGTFEYLEKTDMRRAEWRQKKVVQARDLQGVFSANGASGDPIGSALLWIGSKLESTSGASRDLKPAVERRIIDTVEEAGRDFAAAPFDGASDAMAAYEQLLKRRAKIEEDFDWTVSYLAGQKLLSGSYQAALDYRMSFNSQVKRHGLSNKVDHIYVDLNYLPPPTAALAGLLRQEVPIVFFAMDPDNLAMALALIHPRLDRHLPAGYLDEVWESRVSWVCGRVPTRTRPVLSWGVDDQFLVQEGQSEYTFLRLEGNHIDAARGILEAIGMNTSLDLPSYILATCDGYLSVPLSPSRELPHALFMRSLFFEEILNTCVQSDLDLVALVESLGDAGWRFAGSEADWDRFLKTRYDNYQPGIELNIADYTSNQQRREWDIGSWKQARAYVKRNRQVSAHMRWNKTSIHHHFSLVSGIVTAYAALRAGRENLNQLDVLAFHALGIPEKFGGPTHGLRRFGKARLAFYARRFWPQFDLERIWGVIA